MGQQLACAGPCASKRVDGDAKGGGQGGTAGGRARKEGNSYASTKINVTQLALIWESHDPLGTGHVPNDHVKSMLREVQQLVFKEMLRQKAALESMVSEAMLTSQTELEMAKLLLKELNQNLEKVQGTLDTASTAELVGEFVCKSPDKISKQEFLGQAKRVMFTRI
eukprot:g6277.t1